MLANQTPTTAAPDRIVMLDNFDSFSYNLVDELRQLGYPLVVYRNDIDAQQLIATMRDYSGRQLLCLSPGPGHPAHSGNLLALIKAAQGHFPMLGICLGFQALIHAAGGEVDRCPDIVHGKKALIETRHHCIFEQLDNPLTVARYHSLCGYKLPDSIQVLAATGAIPMAAEFPEFQAIGFQFHPESILTSRGTQLLAQTVAYLFQQYRFEPHGS
ncbi:aminodeoxychorismate/anthranilate synthase component II [Pseudidiomarina andamanensis]|uniref:anthranilate synthase n=1 Tax=Pseudidiomarina andamanensis TaxID=1940690 RepID=A0AA92IKZ6_9GAMM|nr:aminodeoxychorismate/anthranilate synthase component II [Pseudidiomarina andamanensis]MDS0218123.1 aminodeoxychorismate/anthranilate synthase component II [Pseudidiomarina andamanensis]QGT95010.1 aminodeoxychorismate/anthranilate synthase component II [Pseudidiomarina andamanensis]